MDPGSPDSEFGNSRILDCIVPVYNRQRLQEAFVEFNHAAETSRVRDDEMTSWIGNPPLQGENEIPDGYFSEFVHGEQQLIQPVTGLPQQAETTLVQPHEFFHGEQLVQPFTGLPQQAETTLVQPGDFVHGEQLAHTQAPLWQNEEFLHGEQQLIEPVTEPPLWLSDEFLQGEHQLIQPVITEAPIWQPDEFLHGGQQIIQGLPQQAEATLWPEPAVNQPVITPAPQAETTLWPLLEPSLDISDYMSLEPGLVQPPGLNLNTNHHYFTAPAVQNPSWPVPPFPHSSSFAPILNEPAAEATSVVAAVEGAEATAVVAAAEGERERGSTSMVKKENDQVGEQDDGIGSSAYFKRKRENHNGTEKRRREKVNERLEQLRGMIGSEKLDKAALLENICTYLKRLRNQVNTLSMKYGLVMGTGMNMPMPMVPFPAFVPGSTLHNPANTAAQFPAFVYINGQYFGVYPAGHLQAEQRNIAPSSSNNPGEVEDTREPNKKRIMNNETLQPSSSNKPGKTEDTKEPNKKRSLVATKKFSS